MVTHFRTSKDYVDEDARAEYAKFLLSEGRFLYENPDADELKAC